MGRVGLLISAILILVLGATSCAPSEIAPSPTTPLSPPVKTTPTPSPPTAQQPSQLVPAIVTRVIDGDTIDVNIGGSLYRIRYIGIDTPEVGQPGYEEATLANAGLVAGKTVYLEKDISETDKYGRLLRYVWVDGNMVNAALVAMGYAQVATYPPDVKYQNDFLELQRQAREAGLGLWAAQQPVPAVEGVYMGSINSNVYHYPSCRYAQQIYPENEIWFSSSDDARVHGYRPCKVCRPP